MNIAVNRASVYSTSPGHDESHSNSRGVKVEGSTVSWPDDGWYEVQSSTSYNTMSEGQRSATLPHGNYTVINHTTGERFKGITVGPENASENQTNGSAQPFASLNTYRLLDLIPGLTPFPPVGPNASAQNLLNHVEVQEREQVGPPGSFIQYQSVQFLDGRGASLINFSPAKVFIIELTDGSREIFSLDSTGNIDRKLSAGESFTRGSAFQQDITVTVGADGSTLSTSPMSVMTGPTILRRTTVDANLDTAGNLLMTTHLTTYTDWSLTGGSTGGTTSAQGTETASVWSETTLIDAAGPTGAEVTADSHPFEFYRNTEEGQSLINREGDVYSHPDHKRLFIARVKFERNEGGRELFNEFTPRRANLTGTALVEYDALVDKVMDHISAASYNTADNTTLDNGLQYIIASGLVEAFGVDQTRVGQVLSNLSGGWIVSHDGQAGISGPTVNATYWPASFSNQSGFNGPSIGFRLEALVDSYANADDGFEVIAHEAAHALDATSRGSTDGTPPGLSVADSNTLTAERERLFLAFANTSDRLGLDRNAYTSDVEFWAEISERFLSGPDGREVLRLASTPLFDLLTRYFPMSA